jgi:hypothetical protein
MKAGRIFTMEPEFGCVLNLENRLNGEVRVVKKANQRQQQQHFLFSMKFYTFTEMLVDN